MRRRRHKLEVSTFPFLAVLLCAMGSLILLLLVIDRRAKAVARAKAIAVAQRLEAEDAKGAADRAAELERRRRALHAVLENQARDVRGELDRARTQERQAVQTLDAERGKVRELENRIAAESLRLTRQRATVSARKAEASQQAKLSDAAKIEMNRLAVELAQLEQTLADLKSLRQRETQMFSVVPYKGKKGDNRRPIYVECTAVGLIFHPDQKVLSELSESGKEIREEVERRIAQLKEAGDKDARERDTAYLLMLVRPAGINTYYHTVSALSSLKVDFGYEFVESDWVLDFPSNDGPLRTQPWMTAQNNQPPVVPASSSSAASKAARPGGVRGVDFHGNMAAGMREAGVEGGSMEPGPAGPLPRRTGLSGYGGPRAPPGAGGIASGGASAAAGFGNGGSAGGSSGPGFSGNRSGGVGGPGRGPGGGLPGEPALGGDRAVVAFQANAWGAGGGRATGPASGVSANAGGPGTGGMFGGPGTGTSGQGSSSMLSDPVAGTASAAATGMMDSPIGGSGRSGPGHMTGGVPGSAAFGPLAAGSASAPAGGPGGTGLGTDFGTGGAGSGIGPGAGALERGGTGGAQGDVAGGAGAGAPGGGGNSVAGGGAPGSGGAGDASGGAGGGAPSAGGSAGSAGAGGNGGGSQGGSQPASLSGNVSPGGGGSSSGGSGAGGGGGGLSGLSSGGRGGSAGDGDPGDGSQPGPLASLMPRSFGKKSRVGPVRRVPLNLNRDWPLPVLCEADGVTILVTDQHFTLEEVARVRDNPLLAALRTMIDRRQSRVPPGDPPYRPLLRFYVKADGVRAYYLAYPVLDLLNVPMERKDLDPEITARAEKRR